MKYKEFKDLKYGDVVCVDDDTIYKVTGIVKKEVCIEDNYGDREWYTKKQYEHEFKE